MKFGSRAQQYRTNALIQREVAEWCSEWLDARSDGLSALELGAGTGLFTELLAKKGFASLVASDLSQRMVEEGQRCVPQAEWRQADAWGELPVTCDRLYATSVLQWAEDPQRALANWRSALKPGGKVLVGLFVKGSLQEFTQGDSGFSPVRLRDTEEWLALFREAGFEVNRQEVLHRKHQYESAVAALRSLHNIGAVAKRQTGVAQLRSFLAKQDAAHRTNGHFPLTWVALKAELVVRSETIPLFPEGKRLGEG